MFRRDEEKAHLSGPGCREGKIRRLILNESVREISCVDDVRPDRSEALLHRHPHKGRLIKWMPRRMSLREKAR